MMHLTMTPQQGLPGQPEMTLNINGDIITIDGVAYDLSAVPEGGQGEWPQSPISGAITRQNGVLHVTVVVRLGTDAAPDQDGLWVIKNAKGDVTIPAKRVEASA